MADGHSRHVSRFSLDEIKRMVPLAIRRAWSVRDRARIRTDLLYHVSRHPLLLEYLRYHQTNTHGVIGAANTQPWQALGERLAVALTLASVGTSESIYANARFDPLFLGGAITDEEFGLQMAILLLNAQVYLWQSVIDRAVRSYPLPPHVISRRAMPYPVLFFSFQAAARVLEDADGPVNGVYETNWMLLNSTGLSMQMLCDKTSVDGSDGVEFVGGNVLYQHRYPDDIPEGTQRLAATRLLQQLAFINSPYVETNSHLAQRQLRKAVERAGYGRMDDDLSTVRTVLLRRPDPTKQPKSPASPSPTGKVWHHHWWVTAHNKAQWYPSEQAHHVILIGEHVKGDLSKPLLEKVYVVNR